MNSSLSIKKMAFPRSFCFSDGRKMMSCLRQAFLFLDTIIDYWKIRTRVYLEYRHIYYQFKIQHRGVPSSALCLRAYRLKWSKLSRIVPRFSLDWHRSVSGIENPDYVPHDLFHSIVEPILNDFRLAYAYSDKNQYDRLFGSGIFPRVLYRNINGVTMDGGYHAASDLLENYCSGDKLIVKPALNSGGGKMVKLFVRCDDGRYRDAEGNGLSLDLLNATYGMNYLIQPYIASHPEIAKFNPTSLNTVRVVTYRSVKTEEICILGSTIRVGPKGSFLDNLHSGGAAYELSPDGHLMTYGVDDFGYKQFKIGDQPITPDIRVYGHERIWEAAILAAHKLPYCRILGFDASVDEHDQVRLIEVNTRFIGLDLHQNHGNSLFGKYTDEVIEHCEQVLKKRRIRYS